MARALSAFLIALPLAAAAGPPAWEEDEVVEQWSGVAPPRGAALFRAEMLRTHNATRRAAGVAPLTWDEGLAAQAAAYARTLAATRRFAHSPRVPGQPPQGENLWMGTASAYRYRDMTGSWDDEGADFVPGRFPNVSRTGSWHDVGHYTQMIWAGTKRVGCGIASNGSDEYLVCRYFPAGNVWGGDALRE